MAIISDVHCAGTECERQRDFVEWLHALEADALWLLGDIFHAGWYFRDREQTEYAEVYRALESVAQRGIEIVFVPGNHDFGMSGLFSERLGATVRGPHFRSSDGHTVFLAHGDEADDGRAYRALRAVLRSRLFGIVMRLMGPVWGGRFLRSIAGQPSESGEVWEQSKSWLRSKLSDADWAIMGHVHTPWSDGGAVILAHGVAGAQWLVGGELRGQPDSE